MTDEHPPEDADGSAGPERPETSRQGDHRQETKETGGAAGAPQQQAPGGATSVDSPAATETGTTDDAKHKPTAVPAVPQAAPPSLATGVERTGMFGVHGSGDTSGYGGLQRAPYTPAPTDRPYGGPGDRRASGADHPGRPGEFDEVADALLAAMESRGIPASAIEQITVANGELTFYLQRDHLQALFWAIRDDPALRFELMSSLTGVDYSAGDGTDVPRPLHVVYEMTSMTYRRRMRLEVAVDLADPYVPSAVEVYPTADWHERETYDMFGVVFTGHPGLTRILMPDDWEGHPQRKDYPLGGIPVEYKGAEIPPPEERRVYS